MVLFLSILIGMMSGGLITGIKRWSNSLNKTKLHFAIDYTIGVGSGIIGAIIVNHFLLNGPKLFGCHILSIVVGGLLFSYETCYLIQKISL